MLPILRIIQPEDGGKMIRYVEAVSALSGLVLFGIFVLLATLSLLEWRYRLAERLSREEFLRLRKFVTGAIAFPNLALLVASLFLQVSDLKVLLVLLSMSYPVLALRLLLQYWGFQGSPMAGSEEPGPPPQ